MTDYTTKASVSVPATEDEARVIFEMHKAIRAQAAIAGYGYAVEDDEDLDDEDLDAADDADEDEPEGEPSIEAIPAEFRGWDLDDLLQCASGVEVSIDEDGLWLHDTDGTFSNAYAASLVREHLVRTGSDQVISWTYAHGASRPVLDGFGGGIVTVSALDYDIQDLSILVDAEVAKARNRVIAASIVKRHEAEGTDAEDLRSELDLLDRLRDAYALKAGDDADLPVAEVIAILLDNHADPASLEPGEKAPEPE